MWSATVLSQYYYAKSEESAEVTVYMQGSHSNVRLKIRIFSGIFSTRDTKKLESNSVPIQASNNKSDNNNCTIWAQDAMSTQETQIAALAIGSTDTYKIASLVHRNWRAGWADFSGPVWPKISTFSGPDYAFFIFQDLSGPVGTLYINANSLD